MKNITVAVDDEVYRLARVAAAERDTSVSALVKGYLESLGSPRASEDEIRAQLFAALDRVEAFRASDRLTRDEAHAR